MIKKMVFAAGFLCLFHVLSFSVLLANPLLKADKNQLEEWGITRNYMCLSNAESPDHLYYNHISSHLKLRFKVTITTEDVLNPAFKIHAKKELGCPVTPEEEAMAKKKWTANPLLEADDALLKHWLNGISCRRAYTVPGKEKFFNGSAMDYCTRQAIPRIMLDTGVEVPAEAFTVPAVIEKGRKALSNS